MLVTGPVGNPVSYPVHIQIHGLVPIDYESSFINQIQVKKLLQKRLSSDQRDYTKKAIRTS